MDYRAMLEGLAISERRVLASACAQLLRPAMQPWVTLHDSPSDIALTVNRALDAAWILGAIEERSAIVVNLLELVPDEDDPGWTAASAAAQNALAAIAYANLAIAGDEDAPNWAVVQIEEYADYVDQSADDYLEPSRDAASVTSRAYHELLGIRSAIHAGDHAAAIRRESEAAAQRLWPGAL